MSLLTIAEARALITTALDDIQLQAVIDREEAEVVRRLGAHGDGTSTITVELEGGSSDLFLNRTIASITSVRDRTATGTYETVASANYMHWSTQGRLQRLNGTWKSVVEVVFAPVDDRSQRKQVIVELVRLALDQTAMKSESIAGEYSYSAGDWEVKRATLMRRLVFMPI